MTKILAIRNQSVKNDFIALFHCFLYFLMFLNHVIQFTKTQNLLLKVFSFQLGVSFSLNNEIL